MDRGRDIVLLTGAAGRVASLVMPMLRRDFRLRRLDRVAQRPEADDEVVEADICDLDAVIGACRDVRAVIHLAAQPAEADFRSLLLARNLEGTWSVYEAAARVGVARFVFASTIQTVDGYPTDVFVSPETPPRPVSVYGCTKLFGEALGRFHADRSSLGVTCLRIGGVVSRDDPRLTETRFRSLWCGPNDLARLIAAAVRSDVRFATVIAVSPPATRRFDTANPFGWTPVEEPEEGIVEPELPS